MHVEYWSQAATFTRVICTTQHNCFHMSSTTAETPNPTATRRRGRTRLLTRHPVPGLLHPSACTKPSEGTMRSSPAPHPAPAPEAGALYHLPAGTSRGSCPCPACVLPAPCTARHRLTWAHKDAQGRGCCRRCGHHSVHGSVELLPLSRHRGNRPRQPGCGSGTAPL